MKCTILFMNVLIIFVVTYLVYNSTKHEFIDNYCIKFE